MLHIRHLREPEFLSKVKTCEILRVCITRRKIHTYTIVCCFSDLGYSPATNFIRRKQIARYWVLYIINNNLSLNNRKPEQISLALLLMTSLPLPAHNHTLWVWSDCESFHEPGDWFSRSKKSATITLKNRNLKFGTFERIRTKKWFWFIFFLLAFFHFAVPLDESRAEITAFWRFAHMYRIITVLSSLLQRTNKQQCTINVLEQKCIEKFVAAKFSTKLKKNCSKTSQKSAQRR